jgi:hypothetical protein
MRSFANEGIADAPGQLERCRGRGGGLQSILQTDSISSLTRATPINAAAYGATDLIRDTLQAARAGGGDPAGAGGSSSATPPARVRDRATVERDFNETPDPEERQVMAMKFRVSQYYYRTQKREGYRYTEIEASSIEEARKIVAADEQNDPGVDLDWVYCSHDPWEEEEGSYDEAEIEEGTWED